MNSSNTDSQHPALAKAAVGDDAEVVKGENVFRAFYGINRLVLQNVGLNHAIGRAVRFSMHSGSDVGALWSEVTQGTKTRSNIFGSGYRERGQGDAGMFAERPVLDVRSRRRPVRMAVVVRVRRAEGP